MFRCFVQHNFEFYGPFVFGTDSASKMFWSLMKMYWMPIERKRFFGVLIMKSLCGACYIRFTMIIISNSLWLYLISLKRFIYMIRDVFSSMQACISYVKTRFNNEASIVLSAILDLSQQSETRLKAEKSRNGPLLFILAWNFEVVLLRFIIPQCFHGYKSLGKPNLSFQYLRSFRWRLINLMC